MSHSSHTNRLMAVLAAAVTAGSAAAMRPATAGTSAASVYLTAEHRNGIPQRVPAHSFGCGGRVFAVVDAHGLADGAHRLKVAWIDPRGKRRERSRVDFDTRSGSGVAWSWLRLRPPKDSAVARHLFGDATAGYTEFVGDWSARVYLDGSLIGKERFRIAC